MQVKHTLTESFLKDHFVLQGKSMKTIAQEIGCAEKTVSYWVKKHGLSEHARARKVSNLEGQIFGRWTVFKQDASSSRGQAMWSCQCACGTVKTVLGASLLSGKSKSCGCLSEDLFFKGHEQISGSYWSRLIKSANDRGHEFDISIEYAWELFLKQDGKCALIGSDLTFQKTTQIDFKPKPRHWIALIKAKDTFLEMSDGFIKTSIECDGLMMTKHS